MQIFCDMLGVQAMEREWRDRLVAAIKNALDAGQSGRDISRAAKLGPNYVSQFLSSDTRAPRLDEFFRLMEVLDVSPAAILLGFEMDRETQELLQLLRSPEAKSILPDVRSMLMKLLPEHRESDGLQ